MNAIVSVAGDKFASVEDLHRTHALNRSGNSPWRY